MFLSFPSSHYYYYCDHHYHIGNNKDNADHLSSIRMNCSIVEEHVTATTVGNRVAVSQTTDTSELQLIVSLTP